MRKYTTEGKVKNYLLTEIEEWFSSTIDDYIEKASKMIEEETGRIFIADEEASWKDYRETIFSREIIIDDCLDVEELKINGTKIDEEYYDVFPLNNTPKIRIKLKPAYGISYFTANLSGSFYPQNIEVKARWGYSEEVPEDIDFATMVLTVGMMEKSKHDKSKGDIVSESIGPHSLSFSDKAKMNDLEEAKRIIKRYQRMIC